MLTLTSYYAECWTTMHFDPSATEESENRRYEMATLTAAKPNLMRYDSWEMIVNPQGVWSKESETPVFTFVCDGKTNWKQFGKKCRADLHTEPILLRTILEPWDGFYDSHTSLHNLLVSPHVSVVELRLIGTEMSEGTPCSKVFSHWQLSHKDDTHIHKTTIYFGPDNLVRRRIDHVWMDGQSDTLTDAILRNIKTNYPIPDPQKVFIYVPPDSVQFEEQHHTELPNSS